MGLRAEIQPDPKAGFAFASSFVLKTTGGVFYNATVQIDPALGSGTVYVLVLDATAKPADATDLSAGTPKTLASLVVVHVSGDAEAFNIGADLEGWIVANGVVVMLSSTVPTNITASAHLWLVSSSTR